MTDPTPREPDSARSAWSHGSPDGSADAAGPDAPAGPDAHAGPAEPAIPAEPPVPAAEARIADLTDEEMAQLEAIGRKLAAQGAATPAQRNRQEAVL